MKRRRRRINEITDFIEDAALGYTADKASDNVVDNTSEEEKKEENSEETSTMSTPGTSTPTGNNGTKPVQDPKQPTQPQSVMQPDNEEKNEVDPEIESMYQAVEELKKKQEEMGLVGAQNQEQLRQSTEDIMKEIEAYLQQHKK
jgi:hypothetical protein